MSKELGIKIAESLKSLNMTQKELAIRINVSEGVVSRYIKGTRDPKPKTIANIAIALNTTSDYLLGIEKDEYNHEESKRMLEKSSEEIQKKRNLEIGLRIRTARKNKGLNQTEFCKLIDKAIRTVQKYESGEIEVSISMIYKIAEVLDCDVTYLLGFTIDSCKRKRN